jgi:molybdenum cofactor cytidylyltransferase
MTQNSEHEPPVAAVVLAAGGSIRMGELKQLLPICGRPMVRLVTEAVCAAGLDQVVVVVGAQAEAVQRALSGLPVEFARNEEWAAGMSTSVRTGLGVLRPEIQAALMVLADQPGLTPELLRTITARYRRTGAPIVVPVYRGRRGNPVLFDRVLLPELAAAEGDRGGRTLIIRYEARLECVEIDDPGVILDVDTREDYEQAQAMACQQ